MVIRFSSLNKDSVETGRKMSRVYFGIPGGSDGKESTCNAGDLGSIPGLGRSPFSTTMSTTQRLCWNQESVQGNTMAMKTQTRYIHL